MRLKNLPGAIDRITNLPLVLPTIGNLEDSYEDEFEEDAHDLERHEIISIPSNKIDKKSKLEKLLGIKLSGHTDTLTQASMLFDVVYKRCEKQNEQQYRNALDKFR